MDEKKMKVAIENAEIAYKLDEIPVGCAIFCGEHLIACGYNQRESKKEAILHAEIVAISEACKKLGSWRLDDCVLYVTLEPCMMCMGAIIESRIKAVYYGTKKRNKQLYDKDAISSFILMENTQSSYCSKLLSDFFEKKRKK